MKKLSEVVNVVPVIAKADSLTLEEREAFKQKVTSWHCYLNELLNQWRFFKIRAELVYQNIRLYPFDTDELDEEELHLNHQIRVIVFPSRYILISHHILSRA